MGRAVARLHHKVGRRGTALLVFAALDVAYGLRLASASPDAQPFYAWLHGILPLWPWAVLWIAIAVVCALGSVRNCDRVAFTAAIGIKVLWFSLYLSGWVLGDVPDGWVSAVVWGSFAMCVWLIAGWPEPVTSKGQPAWTPPPSE
ncbi:hypothetical protein GA0070563_112106 [Micromonospora carbonacea]|uniref:Uncharacterized protein n=1 Tax=Micromonospora carbonacea TaxID=47853 RepID=A0A1C5AC37_9ACTN|nr:hypothetical protein GA0070563_112106 [Micromonospora carbonacea]